MLRRELLKLIAALPFASLLGIKAKSPIWKGPVKPTPPPTVHYWTGAAGNSHWNDPRNWKPLRLPTDVDEVVLDNGGHIEFETEAPFVITLNVNNGSVSFPVNPRDIAVFPEDKSFISVWDNK